jgi:hypothetical protein
MMGSKIPKSLAYRFLEPSDEVIAVLLLLETGEGHLGTRNILGSGGVHD